MSGVHGGVVARQDAGMQDVHAHGLSSFVVVNRPLDLAGNFSPS
jgi:hypothetical protein